MYSSTIYKEYDTIVAEVLSYFLNKKDNYIIKNFDIKNGSHCFYYEILKICYSFTSSQIYYKTNWLNYIVKKIFFFKKDKIKKANKNTQGCELDFNELYKVLELSETKMSSIYYAYYFNK